MSKKVDILCIHARLDSEGFRGFDEKHFNSSQAKIRITLSNKYYSNIINIEDLLKPTNMGFDSHNDICKMIYCYKEDREKAIIILRESIFDEFYKREKYYKGMRESLINSPSYEKYGEWFGKQENNNV